MGYTISRSVRLGRMTNGRATSASIIFTPTANPGITVNGIPATIANAYCHNHSTTLRRGQRSVAMVEHLLAACAGLGITGLAVLFAGSRLPLLDGSSLPYARALAQAGLVPMASPSGRLRQPVTVRRGNSFATAIPAQRLRLTVTIGPPAVPANQRCTATITPATFLRRIAPARTFGPPTGIDHLPALPCRFRLRNGFLFPARQRLPNEPCRHKLLDLLGDLWLLGRPLLADVCAFRPSHALNLALVRAVRPHLEEN